ncbi:MAG: S49 family peptidase [Chlamydiales bacterium]|nr:S49 family peptidase [Chlamydiales bacterium]
MRLSHESIFSSSIRSFCIAFFALLGICLSLMIVILFLGGVLGSGKKGIVSNYTYEILPDANFQRELLSFHSPVILQIDIHGVIGLEELTAESIRSQLVESNEGIIQGGRVKAILLNINSPGGVVFDADAIYQTLMEYKKLHKIPIYAYVDGLCASGGLYIASAADKIYASDISVIGSVGVISQFFNVSELLNKVGVKALSLTEGKDKDAMNPFRPWGPSEDENYKELDRYFYNRFVDIVVKARTRISKNILIEEYGAKVFPAPLALEHGFIDVAGASWTDAIKALAEVAHISPDSPYQIMRLKHDRWLGDLFSAQSFIAPKTCIHKLELPQGCDVRLANKSLYLYQP